MPIEFDKASRDGLARTIARHLKGEFDLDVGAMDAVLLLDFLSERLGPHYYNQGLADARVHLQSKAESLAETLYELEKPAKL